MVQEKGIIPARNLAMAWARTWVDSGPSPGLSLQVLSYLFLGLPTRVQLIDQGAALPFVLDLGIALARLVHIFFVSF